MTSRDDVGRERALFPLLLKCLFPAFSILPLPVVHLFVVFSLELILVKAHTLLAHLFLLHLEVGNIVMLEPLRLAYEFFTCFFRLGLHAGYLLLLLIEQRFDSVVDWRHLIQMLILSNLVSLGLGHQLKLSLNL